VTRIQVAGLGACLVVAASTLVGCSTADGRGQLSVESFLSLCRGSSCVGVPAKGAKVDIYVGEKVVAKGVLDDTGKFTMRIAPGTYQAQVAMPELKHSTVRSANINVSPGGGADMTIMFPETQLGASA